MPIAPLSINRYQEVPEYEDVTRVDDSIDKKAKKSLKYAAVACGCCIVTTLITLLSIRVSISIMMPPIEIYQTSMYGAGPSHIPGDRLNSLEAYDLHVRGFNVGLLAFGNTECSKLLKVINAGNGIIQGQGFAGSDTCTPPHAEDVASIRVDSSIKYQEIIGFGGAFTESAANNFFKLPPEKQKKIIDLYFGPEGIGYTLGRVHINSCDFSEKSYSFDEIPGDYDLEYFDTEVTHDEAAMMPFIRLAMEASPWPLRLLASPWSPPLWMKVPLNGRQAMNGSAEPNGLIDDPRIKMSWALYISKWITSYESHGVPIWAITPQNEPEFPAPWEACAYNSSYARQWIDGYLGPTMRAHHPEKLILAFDHNKDHLLAWSEEMLGGAAGKGPSEFIDGMAFHWYTGDNDRVMDGTYGYNNVNATYHLMEQGKVLLASEGCSCPGVKIDDWLRAERLAHDIIFDLNNYAQGWIDWNLIVDSKGGPNHLGNMCDAPMVASADWSDVHIQPKFYFMGQFSKFIPPGSVRVHSSVVGNFNFAEGVDPNIRAGVELGAFACEKSSRQQWKFNSDHALELKNLAADSEATDGYMAPLCAAPGNSDRPFLKVSICDAKPAKGYAAPLHITRMASSGLWLDETSGKCLALAGGVSEPGALLELQACASSLSALREHQQFTFDPNTGEVRIPSASGRLCLTAGWPFLTGVAFKQPQRKKTVVVVMNEAAVDSKVILSDTSAGAAWFGIPAKSIQTIVY